MMYTQRLLHCYVSDSRSACGPWSVLPCLRGSLAPNRNVCTTSQGQSNNFFSSNLVREISMLDINLTMGIDQCGESVFKSCGPLPSQAQAVLEKFKDVDLNQDVCVLRLKVSTYLFILPQRFQICDFIHTFFFLHEINAPLLIFDFTAATSWFLHKLTSASVGLVYAHCTCAGECMGVNSSDLVRIIGKAVLWHELGSESPFPKRRARHSQRLAVGSFSRVMNRIQV